MAGEAQTNLQTIPTYSESELIALLKSKDRQGYNYLYDNYAGNLYGIVLRMVGKEETAKDILQEVFVKIWAKIVSYDESKGKLYTWMLKIARNTAIDHLRSSKHQQEINTLEIKDNSDYLNHAISFNIDHLGIEKIVDGLKDEYKQIINLAYFRGYTQEEVAQELNIPIGTVKTRSRSAILQLKTLMQ